MLCLNVSDFAKLSSIAFSKLSASEKRLIFVKSDNDFKTKTENSERIIPMNQRLFDLITEIQKKENLSQYLFASPMGMKLREQRLLHVCKTIAKNAGIESNAFIHKFRHTFATHLVQRRVNIELVSKLLGHSTIRETQIYTHVKSEMLHNEAEILNDIIK
ncbi:MAG: hypothetical protein C4539_04655 [Ignavibacteriales bacterium]|nr:MAG: hypothetical protein C4539_04655 [Ignavibacteriales bacterium]